MVLGFLPLLCLHKAKLLKQQLQNNRAHNKIQVRQVQTLQVRTSLHPQFLLEAILLSTQAQKNTIIQVVEWSIRLAMAIASIPLTNLLYRPMAMCLVRSVIK